MLHCFDFAAGKLKSRCQGGEHPAFTFNSECNSRLGTAIGFGFQNKSPAQIAPFARHKIRCNREIISAWLLPDDRKDRLQEFSVRRRRWLIWIGKYAKGLGVAVDWLQRRIQKDESHRGGVCSFRACPLGRYRDFSHRPRKMADSRWEDIRFTSCELHAKPDFIVSGGQNTPTSINNVDFTPTTPALQEINPRARPYS